MIARLVCYAATLGVLSAGGLACSSSSSGSTAHVGDAGKGGRDAFVPEVQEGGIADATQWEANVPDALLSIADALPDTAVVIDPMNCVPPGTASNAIGVGGYCSPGAGQCNHASPDAGPTVCTADFGAPAHLWFCTVACTSSAQCGGGSSRCVTAEGASTCAPSACGAFAADASVDGDQAGPDAHAPKDASPGGG